MDARQFETELKKKQAQLKEYVTNVFPGRAGDIAVRFVNGNFRAQGWQGKSFSKWKPNARKGTILIKRGILRRGTYYTKEAGVAHVKNNVKYAAFHNNGFKGTVSIKAHQRKLLQATRVATGQLTKKGNARMKTIHTVKGVANVKAHSRKVNMPKRQFMPTDINDSPVLNRAVSREIEGALKTIF